MRSRLYILGPFWLALASCGARPAPVPAISYDKLQDGAVCDAGLWVPQSQEPADYVTCAADTDCVKMAMPGCCSETMVAIRRDRACGSDRGSQCDKECDGVQIRPPGAESQRAVCLERRCTLH